MTLICLLSTGLIGKVIVLEIALRKMSRISVDLLPLVGFLANTLTNNIDFIVDVQYWHLLQFLHWIVFFVCPKDLAHTGF